MPSSTGLENRFLLLAGSVARSCPPATLERAHAFVRAAVRQILTAGGNVVAFASVEPTLEEAEHLPLIFDWRVLEELERYLLEPDPPQVSRQRAWVVTSNKALSRKISGRHRELLERLSDCGAIKLHFIKDSLYTGGNIGDALTQYADAMLVLGGGKGAAVMADKMLRKSAPVLPLDLPLGSLSEDGEGALELLRDAQLNPSHFFPHTGAGFLQQLLGLSFSSPTADPERIARKAVQLLGKELEEARAHAPVDVLLLTALPVELAKTRLALGLSPEAAPSKLGATGTNYWSTSVEARGASRSYGVALSCIGAAGNADAAAAAAELIARFRPRLVVMIGIAAGIRGKCRLGEVILSERVIAYEPASEERENEAQRVHPRPETYRLAHSIHQDLVAYLSSGPALAKRLSATLQSIEPNLPREAGADLSEGLSARLATIASGEKLLRDPSKLSGLRASLHGKIEVGEMEAAGIASACHRAGVDFLIIRGISDFGDGQKDDRFHQLASTGAAIVAVDFIQESLRLRAK
ncbi:MAG TPA: hypothetical protein VF815_10325 [Myxococcaceae bacterium]